MFDKEFLANKFYIPLDYHQFNRYIPSIYRSEFEHTDESGYSNLSTCGMDNNNNILLYYEDYYCTDFDSDNNVCNGSFDLADYGYYVLSNDNNLTRYNMSYYDNSKDDYFLECQGSIALSQNYYDDLIYTNKTSDIISIMFYLAIPLIIFIYFIKVFRKGVR